MKEDRPLCRECISVLGKTILLILFFSFVFTRVFLFTTGDGFLSPSVREGDLIISYVPASAYAAGDLAVYAPPGGKRSEYRVVAKSGDTVAIQNGSLLINGKVQEENYLYGRRTETREEGIAFPVTVPDKAVFLLYDARENGNDSRRFGCVKIPDLSGRVIAILRRRNF